MKRLNVNTSLFFILISMLMACKTEPDANAVRKEVLNIHDKLMVDGQKLMRNKMQLDTILINEKAKSLPDSSKLVDLISRLNQADEKMMDWMHFFKDDYKGKTAEDDMAYYKSEMIKIRAVEDDYIKVIRESDSVLKSRQVVPLKDQNQVHHHQH
jgi:hypothetical protein